MRITALILVGVAATSVSVSGQIASATEGSRIQTLEFCELLKRPDLYHQKIVRIRAVFSRGGEDFSAIYCPKCSTDKTLMWPEYEDSFESGTPPKMLQIFRRHWDVTLAVVLVGRFDNAGGGHMSAYPYLFHIIRIERAKSISQRTLQLWRLTEQQKRKLRC